ncbi:MAG: YrvL family regulatory protein [Romboutsia sp.]
MVKIKNKIPFFELISLILFLFFLLGIAFILFTVIGIGFLSFLGFEYNSFKSVIFFFILYFCIGTPVDFVCTSVLDVIRYTNRLPYRVYKVLEVLFDVSLTFILVNIIDIFMKSITIPLSTEVLFSLMSYAFSQCLDFFDKDNKNNNDSDNL